MDGLQQRQLSRHFVDVVDSTHDAQHRQRPRWHLRTVQHRCYRALQNKPDRCSQKRYRIFHEVMNYSNAFKAWEIFQRLIFLEIYRRVLQWKNSDNSDSKNWNGKNLTSITLEQNHIAIKCQLSSSWKACIKLKCSRIQQMLCEHVQQPAFANLYVYARTADRSLINLVHCSYIRTYIHTYV